MINNFSSWAMSIAGIVCLSVIVELILPNGQMNKYIKGIFSFIIVLVIIMPIPKLLNIKLDFSDLLYNDKISIDKEYIDKNNLNKINAIKNDIENDIDKRGYKSVNLSIECDTTSNIIIYKTVYVDLTSLVISNNAEHKDIIKIKKDISKIILSYIKIGEENILYDS